MVKEMGEMTSCGIFFRIRYHTFCKKINDFSDSIRGKKPISLIKIGNIVS